MNFKGGTYDPMAFMNQGGGGNQLNLGNMTYGGGNAYNPAGPGGAGGFNLNFGNLGGGGGNQGSGIFGGDAGLMGSFLQQKNTDGSTYGGWGSAGLGLAQAGYGMYQGYQQGQRADKMFDYAQQTQERDFDARRSDYNRQLAEQQNVRRSMNPTGANSQMTTADYVSKYGIK
jgi:hypothetical protein